MTGIFDTLFSSSKLVPQFLNLLIIVLPMVATMVVVRRLRGQSLALWLLVVWLLPLIGPVIAMMKSEEKV